MDRGHDLGGRVHGSRRLCHRSERVRAELGQAKNGSTLCHQDSSAARQSSSRPLPPERCPPDRGIYGGEDRKRITELLHQNGALFRVPSRVSSGAGATRRSTRRSLRTQERSGASSAMSSTASSNAPRRIATIARFAGRRPLSFRELDVGGEGPGTWFAVSHILSSSPSFANADARRS